MASSSGYKNNNRMESTEASHGVKVKPSRKGKGKGEDQFSVSLTAEGQMQVLLNATYSVDRDSRYFEVLPFLIDLINDKDRRERKQFGEVLEIRYFPSLEFELGKCKMEDEKCMICLEEFTVRDIEQEMGGECGEDVLVLGCSHKYHKACLLQLIAGKHWAKCPICSTIFGHMTGDQPPGKVTHQVDQKLKCSGYPSGTIVINYQLASGTRNGKPFQGTTRKAYLPDTPDGRGVLQLLIEAFERKLTFTVGRSVTTGLDNQVVWNGIHHKTTTSGGAASFGYPDPTYFTRVREELAAKGVLPKVNL